MLSISIRPIVAILAHPRVRGSVNVVAAFYVDCFNWQRSPVLTFASRYVHPYIQFISRRYAVRSRLGEAQPVVHPCWTRPCYRIWLRHAYIPTHGCHSSRLCADVSSLVMRQKPTRSTVSNWHHTLAMRIYWFGPPLPQILHHQPDAR